MPFKSESQRRLCYIKYRQDIQKDKKPAWDCPRWDEETSNLESLPWRLGRERSSSPKRKRSSSPKKKRSSSPKRKRSSSPKMKRSSSPKKKRSSSPKKKRSSSPKKKRSSSPKRKGNPYHKKGNPYHNKGGYSENNSKYSNKTYTGPKGGKYMIKNGKKLYIKQ